MPSCQQQVVLAVAQNDIPVHDPSSKAVKIALYSFEVWATHEGYNTGPAVFPSELRTYADRDTQAAFEAWNAGAAQIARMVLGATGRLRHWERSF